MTDKGDALLTFSIGPVHTFIAQARRVADLWAGSGLLSCLIKQAIETLRNAHGELVFPFVDLADARAVIPDGLPNRFVCRVPAARASEIAEKMAGAVKRKWESLVDAAIEALNPHIVPSDAVRCQKAHAIEVAWSWVRENGDYDAASREGAQRFAASRLFRPFSQVEEEGEKCAVCGERTALPDGSRQRVHDAWKNLDAWSKEKDKTAEPFFRGDQTRLCLVCATKRLFPRTSTGDPRAAAARFRAFEAFEPRTQEGEESERRHYFAIVSMDGDNMGHILGWGKERVVSGDVASFQKKVSEILTGFAESLRSPGSPKLNLRSLGNHVSQDEPPQLIYAGGEDVLLVCDPRDAVPLATLIRQKYREDFAEVKKFLVTADDYRHFTISAAILIAHTKHPAGLLFRDAERLLKENAKNAHKPEKDAMAIRLAKRGGVPVEVAFRWDERPAGQVQTWLEAFQELVKAVSTREVASRQTFDLRTEEETLSAVFGKDEYAWRAWLTERLSRGEGSAEKASELAELLMPFFVNGKTPALRIARFLAVEVPVKQEASTDAEVQR